MTIGLLLEKVYTQREYKGTYDSSHSRKMTKGLLLCLWEKVHTESEYENTYDSSLAWKMAIGQDRQTFEHKTVIVSLFNSLPIKRHLHFAADDNFKFCRFFKNEIS